MPKTHWMQKIPEGHHIRMYTSVGVMCGVKYPELATKDIANVDCIKCLRQFIAQAGED